MKPMLVPVLTSTATLQALSGRTYFISPLTPAVLANAGASLTDTGCSLQEVQALIDSDSPDRQYTTALSLCLHQDSEVVAILVASLYHARPSHPFQAVCIERVCVAPRFRGKRLGVQFITCAVALYFSALPWLLTVSAIVPQATGSSRGSDLFRRLGFVPAYQYLSSPSAYTLLEIDRSRYLPFGYAVAQYEAIAVPRVAEHSIQHSTNIFYPDCGDTAPLVYFATGSPEKLAQYRHLARCYGIVLHPVKHSVHLAEPQVEGADSSAEAELVNAPLKLFSRFAALQQLYPVMVEDTMLFIEFFNNDFDAHPILPGADTKRWWRSLGTSGIIRLMKDTDKRRARYTCQIGVNLAAGQYARVRHDLDGHIAQGVSMTSHAVDNFPYTNATFFHRIFVPEGATIALAEMDAVQFSLFDYRRLCFVKAVPLLASRQIRVPQMGLFDGAND